MSFMIGAQWSNLDDILVRLEKHILKEIRQMALDISKLQERLRSQKQIVSLP